jgi:uncharacterized protein
MSIETILWRRLDVPGHDSCQLSASRTGWRLRGTAVFRHEMGPAQLQYDVRVDRDWRTREGRVDGWVGDRSVRIRVVRTASGWTVNGVACEAARECVDLDFGFTPATNLLQLRRVALAIGESAEVSVAWLDVPSGELDLLPQRYERRTETAYWYEAPRFDYAAELEVATSGFTRRYPGLWTADDR